jgi:hypothetical protein
MLNEGGCHKNSNNIFRTEMNSLLDSWRCTSSAKYIDFFYLQILFQFVKTPSDTLLRYFNMFHLVHLQESSFLYSWRCTSGAKYIEFSFIQSLPKFLKPPSDTRIERSPCLPKDKFKYSSEIDSRWRDDEADRIDHYLKNLIVRILND